MLQTPEEIRNDPAVLRFADAVSTFQDAVWNNSAEPERWIIDLAQAIAHLYAGAIDIPDVDSETSVDTPTNFDVEDEEWHQVYSRISERVRGAQVYWKVFDPTELQKQEVVAGDLADDIADIYRDVVPGLRAWQAGDDSYIATSVSLWVEPLFSSHWGVHATSALRALHHLAFLRGLPEQDDGGRNDKNV